MNTRETRVAAGLLLLVLGAAFIGRIAVSSDGAEVVSETLGWIVEGRPVMGLSAPGGAGSMDGRTMSRYGPFASLLPLPFLAIAWPFAGPLGASGVEAAGALVWAAGVALCALAFLGLARALRPEASALWAPAFIAGTYLWPYAADSYSEPWAGAALAAGARAALTGRPVLAAVGFVGAALLRPVFWCVAPVLVAALLLSRPGERAEAGGALRAGGVLVAGVVVFLAVNQMRFGSPFESGYGSYLGQFTTPLLHGLWGLLVSPGRGLVFYAPLAVVAVIAFRRLEPRARLLLLGTPLVALLVLARWWAWHGASCWGPRLLLPVLPLLCAPAVLLPVRLVRAAVIAGAIVNLPGVVVAPGVWMGFVERFAPPPAAAWAVSGTVRVSETPALSPLWGHPWLLLRAAGVDAPAPWRALGACEGSEPPGAAVFVSPWWLRRALGLPAVAPILPRILVHNAAGFAARGRTEEAARWARAARRLAPPSPSDGTASPRPQ